MYNQKLADFLESAGSKDVDADIKMLNRLTSDANVKRLERLAINLTMARINLNLTMGLFQGSYASPSNHGIHINIDPIIGYSPDDNFESLWVKCQGMVAHEAGHVLYSDFGVVKDNAIAAETARITIPKIGEKIVADDFDENSEEGKEILSSLEKTIYNYIYYKNLADMLNSVEDGAVEHHTPAYAPRVYGGIVSMRNSVYEREIAGLAKKYPTYKVEDKNELTYFISEIRQYAVIGYRKDLHPVFLPDILSTSQIKEVEQLCLYARICAKNTEERNAVAKVLLDMLAPLMEEKAKKFMDKYLSNLSMSPSDLADMMDQELSGHTEMVCQGAMDPSLAGKTKPQNITSDYQMDLPQSTMDKINQKMKEQQQSSDSGSSGASQSSSQQSSSNDQNNDSGESGEKTEETSDENGNGEENADEMIEGNDGDGESQNKDGENDGNSCHSSVTDKAQAALEAEAAYKDSLQKAAKSFEKENATNFKQSVDSGGGTAPKLSNPGDVNSISDLHKGVKTNYFPSKEINGKSIYGSGLNTSELSKQASDFSKKLKEVLMYQAKTRRKNGLKNGQIHDAALSRIITDQKVFKKTIMGIEKKARLAVLIDLSGSMCGQKVQDAMAAAYMLAEACEKIKVPISIMGHNTGCREVNLFHFVEYENCMKKTAKEKILAAKAGGANHDGLAIFHTATDLVRHRKPGEQLVLLVISDGAPAGINNYWGEVADKDIQNITGAFEKQYNVKTIGIGIGDDVEHVPNIYKNYLLVPNVDKLGNELLKVLKSLLIR